MCIPVSVLKKHTLSMNTLAQPLSITRDRTLLHRRVYAELDIRKNKDEQNIVIRYLNWVPSIISSAQASRKQVNQARIFHHLSQKLIQPEGRPFLLNEHLYHHNSLFNINCNICFKLNLLLIT